MDLQMSALNGIESMIGIRKLVRVVTYSEGTLAQRAPGHHPCCPCRTKTNPPEIAADLAEHTTEGDLTSREIDVLRLISAQLSIPEDMVKSHFTNILQNSALTTVPTPSR
jgi:hypothetical protein